MRKTPLIITLLLVGIVSTYALVVNLFPDTANFPRIPLGNGTIGGIIANILGVSDLANYSADGTVGNTNMLSGMTSTGYLRSSGNCGATKVWTSLDAGMPTCADKNAILASMGTVNTLSGTVTAYHTDGTFETLTSGTGILVGDIIKTNPGTNVTIAFADLSILRVGEDSTVSLDVGTLGSQSLAYAILENGSLWGRVLSETGGYYIGRDDLIVGVRGTSVSFRQSNPTVSVASIGSHWKINKTQSGGIGELNIVQSSTNGTVGTVICKDALGSHEFSIGTGSTIQFGNTMVGCSPALITVDSSIVNTYAKPDIAKNVIADLDYMSGVLASTIAITATQRTKITTEFTRSRPTTLGERGAICPIPGNGLARIFWDSLMRTNIDTCQETDVLAVANFRGIDIHQERNKIFTPSGVLSPIYSHYTSTNNGIEIMNNGEYLEINTGALGFNLAGKNIEMVVDGILAVSSILIDFTGNPGLNGKYRIQTSASGFECKWTPGDTDCVNQTSLGGSIRRFRFVVPPVVEIMTFGNWINASGPSYNKPFGGTIKSIRILN